MLLHHLDQSVKTFAYWRHQSDQLIHELKTFLLAQAYTSEAPLRTVCLNGAYKQIYLLIYLLTVVRWTDLTTTVRGRPHLWRPVFTTPHSAAYIRTLISNTTDSSLSTLHTQLPSHGQWNTRFICGLTACTPASAPGPTLGNKYGKRLLLLNWNARAHTHTHRFTAFAQGAFFSRVDSSLAKSLNRIFRL